MRNLFLNLLLIVMPDVFAQDTGTAFQGSVDTIIECKCFCFFPDIKPQFPGGDRALATYISENLVYPDYVPEIYRNGTVVLRFMVNADGKISEVKIQQSLCPELDKAAIAVISGMPKWTPGEQAGKRVRTRFDIPIRFTYQ